jgi:hypothetical protein
MSNVSITTDNGQINVDSPYHEKFVNFARNLNGNWTGEVWAFDCRDEERVREKLFEVYGTDGSDVATVDVRMTTDKDSDREDLTAFGRVVLRLRSRDEKPDLGEGVALIEGTLKGGGSRKYPEWNAKNAVLEVRDVPVTLAEESVMGWDTEIIERDDEGGLTPQEQALADSLADLPEERRRAVIEAV